MLRLTPLQLTHLTRTLAEAFAASLFVSECYPAGERDGRRWHRIPELRDRSVRLHQALRFLRAHDRIEQHPRDKTLFRTR